MLDADKKQFAKIVRSTMLVTGGEAPEPDVLRIWWAALKNYAISDVSAAFSEYAIRGKFAPKPADILGILDRMLPDGRLGADEAWAMIPRDEASSVVWTDEMAQAFGIALPLLNEGDAIAARMAFKEAYVRIIDANKRQGIAPNWKPSLGHNPDDRERAISEAMRLGRISPEHAQSLLPAPIDYVAQAKLLQSATIRLASVNGECVSKLDHSEKLKALRDVLGGRKQA